MDCFVPSVSSFSLKDGVLKYQSACLPLQVVAQLQAKNAELVLRTAKISEQELEELQAEFEKRLGAAERKVGRVFTSLGAAGSAASIYV